MRGKDTITVTDADGQELAKIPASGNSLKSYCASLIQGGESPLTVMVNLSGTPICGMADRDTCESEWTKCFCQSTIKDILSEADRRIDP